jgi:hypothetical protein
MSLLYNFYFTFVFILFIYGFKCNIHYLCTFLVTNMYYTLGEYVFHRFTFHNSILSPALTRSHSKHHDQPTNEKRLFIPITVTLLNDILFIFINYMCNMNVLYFLSASHLSYLLFEASHYTSHIPNLFIYLPKRLVSFHTHHHFDSTKNFGFTSPTWDIIFQTSSSFSLYYYPLSYIPISIISFLSISEIVILSNLIYIYPAYYAYKNTLYLYSLYYLLTGVASSLYHKQPLHFYYKSFDYIIAIGYFVLNLYFYSYYRMTLEPIIWCILSCVVFIKDTNHYSHILWHLITGIGVGRMMLENDSNV